MFFWSVTYYADDILILGEDYSIDKNGKVKGLTYAFVGSSHKK